MMRAPYRAARTPNSAVPQRGPLHRSASGRTGGATAHPAVPPHWQLRPARMMLIAVIAAICGGGLVWWAHTEWAHQRRGVAVTIGGWGVIVGGAALMAMLMSAGLLRSRADEDGDAVTLLPSRSVDVIARVLLVVMTVCGVAGLVVWWRGGAELAAFSGRQQIKWVMASALLAALGVVSCPWWFRAVGPLGYLRLGSSGVTYRQGFGTVELLWKQIAEITDEYPSRRKLPCPITFRLAAGGLKVFVPGAFGRDPAEIYWMVHHYWTHRDDRGDLGDGQTLRRLNDREFSGLRR
jgi:hypothetical protein